MKIKEIGFVAIPVTDMDRARKFYEGVLGLKEIGRFMDGKWIEYGIGKDTLCIASISDTWTPSDQGTGAALEMEDFEEAIRLKSDDPLAYANLGIVYMITKNYRKAADIQDARH